MKRDEVLNMSAGRELDALVAEKVMGVVNMEQWCINYRIDKTGRYSTDLAAAWTVSERAELFKDWRNVLHRNDNPHLTGKEWEYAYFYSHYDDWDFQEVVQDNSVPVLLCKAALIKSLNL